MNCLHFVANRRILFKPINRVLKIMYVYTYVTSEEQETKHLSTPTG